MKIVTSDNAQDFTEWHVGDIVCFGDNDGVYKGLKFYGMIIRTGAPIQEKRMLSMVLLNGSWPGDLSSSGISDVSNLTTTQWRETADQVVAQIRSQWDYVKKVSMYGVVNKSKEDHE